ncbi:MAG TPA: ATP-binding cassette domain-containing protein [Caulobacteraceae bacterium]|nr:ATP-binding cassette domain-containing protein [Caulobacteraceae bacterium]
MSRKPIATPAVAWDSAAPQTVVRFEGVSMRYGREPEVLKDISFELPRGSFHFLTGPSGSGKSTLLKLIFLAEQASRGRIEIFGRDVALMKRAERPAMRRKIGVVFQEFRLLDHLSVFDNAALGPRIAGRKAADYRADVADLLAWVGLGDRMHAMPPALSGGEKQRLAIARAVINRPDILLADEPTGNVDDTMALRILRLFVELNRVGATVLIASHDRDLVARAGVPALKLEDGRLAPHPGFAPEVDA